MTVYYVNNVTGNNNNSGRSTSEAFKTISKAAGVVSAGDTVNVMDGGQTYYETVRINRSGKSGNVITFQNYSGHSPTIDGRATGAGGGLPTAGKWTLFNPNEAAWSGGKKGTARGKGSGGLVLISGSYVEWDGINVKGSLSRGILIIGGARYSKIKNCTIGPNYAHNTGFLENSQYCEIDNCDIKGAGNYYPKRRGTTPSTDGCAAVIFHNAHYCTLKNSRIYNNWGESTICDANWGASSHNTIEDCAYWDNMKGCYIHGSTHMTVQRCIFFRTQQERNQLKYNGNSVRGLSAGSVENNKYPNRDKGGKNLTFINNIFAGMGVAMLIKGSKNRDDMKNCLFANNTAVNCNVAWALSVKNKSNMVFKNNIEYNNNTAVQGTGSGELGSGWTVDYNHWESSVHANATGANDVVGNPSLENPNFTITGSGANANYDATKYRLKSGSTARGAAQDLSGTFTKDYGGDTRSAWDMGAYEYDGNSPPSAAITASATSGNAPLSIDFEGDPNSMTSYAWDFGDGGTSDNQDQTYIYQIPGVYTATLTVTDSNGLTDLDTKTITVLSTTSASAPLVVEQVDLNEADTSYTVSATTAPKAALYYWSGATSAATAANHSQFGIGIAAGAGLANQYSIGTYGEHGLGTTETARQVFSDAAITFANDNGNSVSQAEITGASATTVSLSWTGTSANEIITSLNLTGNALSNQSIELVETQNQDGTFSINGDWNLAIMPFVAHEIDNNTGAQSFSFGFAKRGGNQVCVAYHNRDNQTTTEQKSATFSDRIAHSFRHQYGLQISSWSNSQITFKTIEDDGNGISAPVLLMHIDSNYEFDVQLEQSPTATGNNDYTANYGYDPQAVIGIITNHESADTTYVDDTAGVFGIFSCDSSADRTSLITSKDAATTSDEQSYSDVKWVQLDEDTTVIGVGALSCITNGFRINPTTAHSTAYQMPVLVIETSSTGSGAVASFDHDADENTDTNTTINFYDTSAGSPSSWAWDFGDGSGTSSSQNPTYSYSAPGTYTVELEVDGGGGLKTTTQEITVNTPEITISYTITPTSGTIPLTVDLDASGSSTISGKTIDDERTRWEFRLEGETEPRFVVNGTEAELTIDIDGSWNLYLAMWHTDDDDTPTFIEEENVLITSADYEPDFSNTHGDIVTTGNYLATFTPVHGHPLANESTYDWDFGDTNTDSTTGPEAVTNTYATVGSLTEYDVELVVTYPDGTTDTVTKADYITIVPTPTAPDTLAEMMTRLDSLDAIAESVKEHMGIIDGTWTKNSTYPQVYEITLSRIWTNGLTVTVYEDGSALTSKASVAQVAAAAGSFYTSFSSPNLTIYVRTTDTDNPGMNDSDYIFKAVT